MTPDEARRLLDLAPSASAEQIRQRFTDLSRQVHPDSAPGAGGIMAGLVQARDAALRDGEKHLPTVGSPNTDRNAPARSDLGEQVRRQLCDSAMRPSRFAQRFLALLGGASLATLALFQERLAGFIAFLPESARAPTAALLGIGGLVALVGAAIIGLKMLFARQALDDIVEHLSDPDGYFETLRRTSTRLDEPMTSSQLRGRLEYYIRGIPWQHRILAGLPVPRHRFGQYESLSSATTRTPWSRPLSKIILGQCPGTHSFVHGVEAVWVSDPPVSNGPAPAIRRRRIGRWRSLTPGRLRRRRKPGWRATVGVRGPNVAAAGGELVKPYDATGGTV